MAYQKRSKKLLIIATTITIVTLAIVLSVYSASILGTFQTGSASISKLSSGTITYSADNKVGGTWIAKPTRRQHKKPVVCNNPSERL